MPTLAEGATLFSVGQIADRLGVPLHRVIYIVDSRRIVPRGRIGNARAFAKADIARISRELNLSSDNP